MEKDPKVAIIILNWNGFSDTIRCLNSLVKLNYSDFRVVLVDNGSDGDEGDRIKEMFPDVHLIRNSVNKGFAEGNNDGIKWAVENNFGYVWILNNDTVVDKNSLKKQIACFSGKNVGVVGSKIKITGGERIWSKGIDLIRISIVPPGIAFFSNIDEGKKDTADRSRREMKYISGCSMMFRTDLENIFFSDKFFAYCEDMELCLRIRREGCRLVYEPGSVVYHKATRSSGGHKFNEITAYYGYRNKIIFIRDAFGLYVLLLLMPFYAACFLRDIAKTVLFYDRKKILIRAMMKGFIDGARYILR